MLVTSVSGTPTLPLTYLKAYNINMNNKVSKGKVSTVSFSLCLSSFFLSRLVANKIFHRCGRTPDARSGSELPGELLGRTSCDCTDGWLAVASGWSHCIGSTACSGNSGCSGPFNAYFYGCRLNKLQSSSEVYCTFYSFPLRLVT